MQINRDDDSDIKTESDIKCNCDIKGGNAIKRERVTEKVALALARALS